MWSINIEWATASRFKKFAKKHKAELAACFANLEKLRGILNAGKKIGGFNVGFLRSERDGLYRIGQTGVRSPKEARLYIYPDQESTTVYVLGVGTKETQQRDIGAVKEAVKGIKREGTKD